MKRRFIWCIALAALFVSLTNSQVGAESPGYIGNDKSGSHDRSVTVSSGGHGAGTGHTDPAAYRGTSGPGPTCFTETGRSVDVTTTALVFKPVTHDNPIYPAPTDDHHIWQITHCVYPNGTRTNDTTLIDTTPGPTPAPTPTITPAQLALRATANLHLDFPNLQLSPPTRQVTGFPTWYWINPDDWQPQHATDTDGALTVTLTATPNTLTIDPGDTTTTIDCHGPGTPYQPGHTNPWATSTCGHTYTRPGTPTIHATLTWHFTWQANNGTTGTLPNLQLDHQQPLTITAYTTITN